MSGLRCSYNQEVSEKFVTPRCPVGTSSATICPNAVAVRRTSVSGEKRCAGWLSKSTIGTVQCQNILRYKFNLGYGRPERRTR